MNYSKYYSSDGFDFVLYQDLSTEDALKVLSYRNHFDVRKWMFNTQEITKEDHFKFIVFLKNNRQKVHCAVFRGEEIVACVNYEDKKEGNYFAGHYINPRLLSSGIGLYFEYVYLKFFFEHIKAKMITATVKKENSPMINIHRLCNFQAAGENRFEKLM